MLLLAVPVEKRVMYEGLPTILSVDVFTQPISKLVKTTLSDTYSAKQDFTFKFKLRVERNHVI